MASAEGERVIEPRSEEPTFPPRKASSPAFADDAGSAPRSRPAGIMAALIGRAEPTHGDDPRASIIRLDTVDQEPIGYARRMTMPPEGNTPQTPARLAALQSSGHPAFRATQLDIPGSDVENDNTNPGVKLSDLRKKARDGE
jgi:hypothetical protein